MKRRKRFFFLSFYLVLDLYIILIHTLRLTKQRIRSSSRECDSIQTPAASSFRRQLSSNALHLRFHSSNEWKRFIQVGNRGMAVLRGRVRLIDAIFKCGSITFVQLLYTSFFNHFAL